MEKQPGDIFWMLPYRSICCGNQSKLCFNNRILIDVGDYGLVSHNEFAYLAKPIVEVAFSYCMQFPTSPTGKTTGLLGQENLLPLLNAVLHFDLLDLI